MCRKKNEKVFWQWVFSLHCFSSQLKTIVLPTKMGMTKKPTISVELQFPCILRVVTCCCSCCCCSCCCFNCYHYCCRYYCCCWCCHTLYAPRTKTELYQHYMFVFENTMRPIFRPKTCSDSKNLESFIIFSLEKSNKESNNF